MPGDMSLIACHDLGCEDVPDWLISHGILIGVAILGALILLTVARLAVRRMQRRLESAGSATEELSLQRSATLTQALSYVIRIGVWTVTILLVLAQIGLDIGPLIAGAGIVGVALGFGAQTIVRDFLSGFFILLENQYGVGDSVTLFAAGQEISGKVEALDLRTTEIRNFDGTLHTISNGNVLIVGNTSRGWARAIVDVRVGLNEDLDRVRQVLDELFAELRQDESLDGSFFSGPEVLGVEQLGDKDVTLRVTAEVRPTRRGDLERHLRQRIKTRFDERGITMAPSS
jgi:small conductance mechanosensitive channel